MKIQVGFWNILIVSGLLFVACYSNFARAGASDISFKLTDDKKSVVLTLTKRSSGPLKLDADEVDQMLQRLGQVRATMQPEIPRALPREEQTLAVGNPALAIAALRDGGSVLHVRDPRYGWLHYAIPAPALQELATMLANLSSPAPPAPGRASEKNSSEHPN